ncbi:MAG: BMP family ABC transporter substrate-binding protein [Lachnospiraceae bacterium]|jgi:basic membrane protein A|nr:BMP family ABC transporter substrate-binding protein [Lachnospiraceae bacterium]
MKRLLALMLSVCMMAGALSGCGKKEDPQTAPDSQTEEQGEESAAEEAADKEANTELPKVACLLNGNLGDKSFFDSANAGMKLIKDELGCETNVIEMGFDNTVWETTLYEVSDQDWDIIIVGTFQMQEVLEKVALEYPDKKYIIFDSTVSYDNADYSNVYSISFKQNEASYLAGALAAMIAADDSLPLSNGQKMISVVAALDIPVLNDFIMGYIQGAVDTVPDTKVSISYIGNFDDTAKAKDLAKAQFGLGSCVAFNVAAQAGLGMIEAAGEAQKYAIGVDADQAMALAESQPEQSKVIATSVMKNIDQVLLLSVKRHIAGELPYGQEESLGMEENAVGLAVNEVYDGIATDEMKAKIEELQGKIQSGEIKVNSAFTMTDDEIKEVKDSVAP